MITSRSVCGGYGKAFDKIQHPFIINIQSTSNGKELAQPDKRHLEKNSQLIS